MTDRIYQNQYHFKSFQIIRDFAVENPLKGMKSPSILTGHIITTAGVPRDYRRCKCAKCGVEDINTPRTAFDPRADDPKGLLYCRRCK